MEGSAVIASDRCYFALGAEERPVPGGAILHLDGLGAVGAATVTWVDRPAEIIDPRAWVADVAAQAGEILVIDVLDVVDGELGDLAARGVPSAAGATAATAAPWPAATGTALAFTALSLRSTEAGTAGAAFALATG